MKKRRNSNPELRQRVITFLNREQVDFLDKIGKDALFFTGNKLSRIKIISALVDLMMELDLTGERISSPEELKQKIKEKIAITWPATKEILLPQEKETEQKRQEG